MGGPFISACSLKQTDRRASHSPIRPAIVFFRQDLLGFGVVGGEFKGHMLSLCLSSLRSLSLSLSLSISLSWRGGCDFNTILIRNHSTGEENIVPESFRLILVPQIVRIKKLLQSPMPSDVRTSTSKFFFFYFLYRALCSGRTDCKLFSIKSVVPAATVHCYLEKIIVSLGVLFVSYC